MVVTRGGLGPTTSAELMNGNEKMRRMAKGHEDSLFFELYLFSCRVEEVMN